jgi:restriction system protein
VIERLGDQFALSQEDLERLNPSGRARTFANRVGWATTHLRKAGLLENVGWGRYRLTDRGRHVLATQPVQVNMRLLDEFAEYREWRGAGPATIPGKPAQPTNVDLTPEEMLETTHRELHASLEQDLLDRVREVSPSFFERLVVDLVVAMGYGGSHEEAGRAVGQSGDEGIDGIINEDRLGLDVIYLQAKRWASPVGRPTVQMFAGSLEGKRASKGVFITTSFFTGEARDYVRSIGKTIILIDGQTLARLMIEYGVGVSETARYVVRRIDSDYFEAG